MPKIAKKRQTIRTSGVKQIFQAGHVRSVKQKNKKLEKSPKNKSDGSNVTCNWQPGRDSNPDGRLQRPLCCHYTTRLKSACRRSESNRHGINSQRFLRPPCLPFHHSGYSYGLYLIPPMEVYQLATFWLPNILTDVTYLGIPLRQFSKAYAYISCIAGKTWM